MGKGRIVTGGVGAAEAPGASAHPLLSRRMAQNQTPREIVKDAHAEKEAEAWLSGRLDHLLTQLGEAPQGWHAAVPEGWTPETGWTVVNYVLEVVHRAGLSEQFRALLLNLALDRRDGAMLVALGAEKIERDVFEKGRHGEDGERQAEVQRTRGEEHPGFYALPENVPHIELRGDSEPLARELVRRVVEREADNQTRQE